MGGGIKISLPLPLPPGIRHESGVSGGLVLLFLLNSKSWNVFVLLCVSNFLSVSCSFAPMRGGVAQPPAPWLGLLWGPLWGS